MLPLNKTGSKCQYVRTDPILLAALMEQRTGARRILLVGHTATLYRTPLDKSS